MEYSWTCECCGQQFDTLPMDFAFHAPQDWFDIPEAERASRTKLSRDLCMIDRRKFYVRGCIEVPVSDHAEFLIWGVWVSVSEKIFRYIYDHWDDQEDSRQALPGELCNWPSGYPDSRGIRCDVFLRSGNRRPRIVLEEINHPLSIEQRTGISLKRVKEIAAASHVRKE